MKSVITLWKDDPLKCNFFPLFPVPFSPVQRALKFSAHLGVASKNSSKTIFPSDFPFTAISKKTSLFTFFYYYCCFGDLLLLFFFSGTFCWTFFDLSWLLLLLLLLLRLSEVYLLDIIYQKV